MLHINDLIYRVGGRALFDGATAAVASGQRVGLVGRNGSGKTTLLRLILGEAAPDGGEVRVNARARVGALPQEAPGGPASVLDTVLAADRERANLLAEADHATDGHRIAEIHTRLADIQAHTAAARAGRILAGLGFDEDAQRRPCGDFSGGWRMRIALAAVLFSTPDLLLLDEPSNHLDLESELWLENFLATYPHTLILISHDRDLLNKAVDRILYVEGGKLVAYAGNYDRFERTRRERLEHQAAMRTRQEAERQRIQAFVDRFRVKATKARQAQSRLKALARMQPIPAVLVAATPRLEFPEPGPLAPPLLVCEGAAVGYGDAPVLSHLDLRIDGDDRIALLGANGNGKTTLARLLAGRLKAAGGAVRRSRKLRVGYFAQDQFDELDPAATAFANLARAMPEATDQTVRGHLGRFGFSGERVEICVGDLSGGERARLLFALLTRSAPHLVILDEPTNHLDVDAREALVQALNAFSGAVILISHDPHLVGLIADRLWLVRDGTCRPYDGDLDDYRRLLLAERRERAAEARGESAPRSNRKAARQAAAAARERLAPLRRAVTAAEKRLARLNGERERLRARLADPAVYKGPAEEATGLRTELGRLDRAVAKAEEAWLSAHDALEAAE